MNWDQVKGEWKQLKGSMREQWAKLTDDDLEAAAGDRDKLLGKIQERYGYEKDRAAKFIDEAIEKFPTKRDDDTGTTKKVYPA
jgi:uncharacterized protein YjbJ (UPF0337 family)